MANESKITRRALLFFVGAMLLAIVCLAWIVFKPAAPVPPVEFDNYSPSLAFEEAYDVMNNAARVSHAATPAEAQQAAEAVQTSRPRNYNLERTYRAIRAFELAQQESGDWSAFLKHVKNQDYRGVPFEVVEAQVRILPILDRIHEFETELGESTGAMAVLNAIGAGVAAALDNADLAFLASVSTGKVPFGSIRSRAVMEQSYNAALEKYKTSGWKRKAIARQLKEVQLAYIKYLAGYLPVRRAYEDEWNALCLLKDRACLHAGNGAWASAAETAKKLCESYPFDREGRILQALALSRLALSEALEIAESTTNAVVVDAGNPRIVEANAILERYLTMHPDSAAPALVVKGLMQSIAGDADGAMATLDQAAAEYPQEAAKLNDMLEAYVSRPHLEKSAEGQRLVRQHRALCEGFGMFSPGLVKAFVLERAHDYAKAREEIAGHFFRRGDKGSAVELAADMEFCEKNLSMGFKGLLAEHSYLDVDYEQVRNAATLGMTSKGGVVEVSLSSRADFELKNVRLFLCIQFAGMYKGEYEAVRVGPVGVLKPGEKCMIPDTPLGRKDKTYRDVANVRAIVMTDDKICWVDSVRSKRAHALNVASGVDRLDLPYAPDEYLAAFGMTAKGLASMAAEAPVTFEPKIWPKVNMLEISLPRMFAVLEPVFSIGEIGADGSMFPEENRVAGNRIVLRFPSGLKDGAACDLFMYSDFAGLRIALKREGKDVSVVNVSPRVRPVSGMKKP